jgi:hypothetical protein
MPYLCSLFNSRRKLMIIKTIKLRLPKIQLLAVIPTQLKFSIVKVHDETTILCLKQYFVRGSVRIW